MFRRMLRFLSKPWLLALLGVLAFSLVIWFVGPLVAVAGHRPLDSVVMRLLVVLVIVTGWGLNNLRLRASEREAEQRLTNELASDADRRTATGGDADSNPEAAILAARLKEALETVRRSGTARQGGLYRLPWYMLIGAPGSGKSTMIRSSGMRFPLQDQIGDNPVAGEGGTRYCDWWFADEAVFIDTAGRYTAQDNARAGDSAAWLSFLGLLRRRRPRQPLNGIIVTASVVDLADRSPTQLARHRTAIRRRIQELNRHLSMRLPVYLVFTKCDLVAGFGEYFADLDREGREQPWGVTLPAPRKGGGEVGLDDFPQRYAALLERAESRVLNRLRVEQDTRRRGMLYEFPRQMVALGDGITRFVSDVFGPNQFEPGVMLRGVYFVSGAQTDCQARWTGGAIAPAIRSRPRSAARAAASRGYFITGLLSRVVLPEAGLATASPRAVRRYRLGYVATLAAVLTLFLAGIGAWSVSHRANETYMSSVDAAIDSYRKQTGGGIESPAVDWGTLAAGLDSLRGLSTGYTRGYDDAPLRMTFGLYQGRKVGAQAERTYRRALERFLVPKLSQLLRREIDLDLADPAVDGQLYEALRCYLMLYHPRRMVPKEFIAWTRRLWSRRIPGDRAAGVREALVRHVRSALAEEVALPPPDRDVITRARRVLSQTPLAKRAYRKLKNDYRTKHDDQFSVASVLGDRASALFRRVSGRPLDQGVPRFYTYEYFHAHFLDQSRKIARRLAQEQWIYGDDAASRLSDTALEGLTSTVRDLYFHDYVSHWTRYLGDLRLLSFSNLADARTLFRALADKERPLSRFLAAVRHNTALSDAPASHETAKAAADSIGDKMEGRDGGVVKRVGRVAAAAAAGSSASPPGEPVAEAFADFNQFATPAQGLPLSRLRKALEETLSLYRSIVESRDVGNAAFEAWRQSDSATGAVADLRHAMEQAPPAVRQWLRPLRDATRRVLGDVALRHVNEAWRANVYSFYERAIAGHYPVDPNAGTDITLEDFQTFFGPGGRLQAFYKANVAPFADSSGAHWHWRRPPGMSESDLRIFRRAERIRRAYFRSGKPGAVLLVKPYRLDPVARRSLLETAGSDIVYEHGPIRATRINWPGAGARRSRLVYSLASRGTPVSARARGPWSLFHLLDGYGHTRPLDDGNGLLVTFAVRGVKAQYTMRAQGTVSALDRGLLRHFEIPGRL